MGLVVVGSAACGGESITPLVPEAADTVASVPAEESFSLTGFPVFGLEGWSYQVRVVEASGAPMAGRLVTWTNSDSSVAMFGGNTSGSGDSYVRSLLAVAVGSTIVTATVDGQTLEGHLEVIADPPASTGLAVDSFRVTEFSYGSSQLYYAPQVRIAVPATSGNVVLSGAQFEIPGLGTGVCMTRRIMEAGADAQLNRESWGDFELTFELTGERAAPGSVRAVLYFIDGQGLPGKAAFSGPIVGGSAPRTLTYANLDSSWGCSFPVVASSPDPR
jgi:hypothetical protein